MLFTSVFGQRSPIAARVCYETGKIIEVIRMNSNDVIVNHFLISLIAIMTLNK